MAKTIATSHKDDYMALVRELPLKKLRTERDHAEALKMSGQLIGSPRKLTDPKLSVPKGIDVLKHLISEQKMSQRQLAHLLGIGDSAASMILSGTRELTKSHIQKLSRHFGVGVGAFFENRI
jgi:antitoxin component HigA of HigAB toxin-antitoxin module